MVWAHLDDTNLVVSLVFALSQVHFGLLVNYPVGLEVAAIVFAEGPSSELSFVWLGADLELAFVALQVRLTERVIHARSCLVVEVDAVRFHWDKLILVITGRLFTRWAFGEVSGLYSVGSHFGDSLGLDVWRVCLLGSRLHTWPVCSLVSLVRHLLKFQQLIVACFHMFGILGESVHCWVQSHLLS